MKNNSESLRSKFYALVDTVNEMHTDFAVFKATFKTDLAWIKRIGLWSITAILAILLTILGWIVVKGT